MVHQKQSPEYRSRLTHVSTGCFQVTSLRHVSGGTIEIQRIERHQNMYDPPPKGPKQTSIQNSLVSTLFDGVATL